jgi:hypothetical protein
MKKKKISRRALTCVLAMSQGDRPTYGEFLAAWEHGLIDTTPKAEEAIRKERKHD